MLPSAFHLFSNPELVITTPYTVLLCSWSRARADVVFFSSAVDRLPYSMWAVDTELSLALTYVILLLPLHLAPSEPKGQIRQVPLEYHKCTDCCILLQSDVRCACYCSIELLTPCENPPTSKILNDYAKQESWALIWIVAFQNAE